MAKSKGIEIVIRKLRRSLPKFKGCKRCGRCCGPVYLTDWEYQKILNLLNHNQLWNEVRDNIDLYRRADDPTIQVTCLLMRFEEDGTTTCMVYCQRPVVCKLYGLHKDLPCQNSPNETIDKKHIKGMAEYYNYHPKQILEDELLATMRQMKE